MLVLLAAWLARYHALAEPADLTSIQTVALSWRSRSLFHLQSLSEFETNKYFHLRIQTCVSSIEHRIYHFLRRSSARRANRTTPAYEFYSCISDASRRQWISFFTMLNKDDRYFLGNARCVRDQRILFVVKIGCRMKPRSLGVRRRPKGDERNEKALDLVLDDWWMRLCVCRGAR